ncbi:MAG: hypothetical protein ACQEQS_01670 [Thermodesulfobacteriota bacterium]
MENKTKFIKRDKFDFEIGYLIKSPCINCPDNDHLPHCQKACRLIDSIQEELSAGISSVNSE